MPDVLDQIQQQQTGAEDAALTGAKQAADWSNTYSSIPDEERLRATRNLTGMVAQAIERRQQIAAQTDENAQRLYFNAQKFKDWQNDQPKRAEYLQSQINHEQALTGAVGAHERYQTQLQTDTANDVTGFYHDIADIPFPPGTPEYADSILGLREKHPLALNTKAVADDLAAAAKHHDRLAESAVIAPMAGMKPKGATRDTTGKVTAAFEPEDAGEVNDSTPGVEVFKDTASYAKRMEELTKQGFEPYTRFVKGKGYVIETKAHIPKPESDIKTQIDDQIKAGSGEPLHVEGNKAQKPDKDHPATHYRVTVRNANGAFSTNDVPVAEYDKIKNATQAPKVRKYNPVTGKVE